MNLEEIKNEVLEHLYQGYLQSGGTSIFDVTDIITKYNQSPSYIGRYLANNNWVIPQQGPSGFAASVTIAGIEEIHPEYVNGHIFSILVATKADTSNWFSLMELLEFDPKDYQRAHHLATLMKDRGLIEVQFLQNDILVKLTMEGRDYYESNEADFF